MAGFLGRTLVITIISSYCTYVLGLWSGFGSLKEKFESLKELRSSVLLASIFSLPRYCQSNKHHLTGVPGSFSKVFFFLILKYSRFSVSILLHTLLHLLAFPYHHCSSILFCILVIQYFLNILHSRICKIISLLSTRIHFLSNPRFFPKVIISNSFL